MAAAHKGGTLPVVSQRSAVGPCPLQWRLSRPRCVRKKEKEGKDTCSGKGELISSAFRPGPPGKASEARAAGMPRWIPGEKRRATALGRFGLGRSMCDRRATGNAAGDVCATRSRERGRLRVPGQDGRTVMLLLLLFSFFFFFFVIGDPPARAFGQRLGLRTLVSASGPGPSPGHCSLRIVFLR